MKIDLFRIPTGGLDLSEDLSPADLELEDPEVKYQGPLKITAHVDKYTNTANVDASVEAVVNCRCSRCLEPFTKQLEEHYKFHYSPDTDGQYADISEDIRQELLLSYNVKNLCKADCKGLCVKCGENLNTSKCKCA